MAGYYNLDGSPMPLMEWADKFEYTERHIGHTRLWFGLVRVSTVWPGLDHDFSWMANHKPGEINPHPLQFETMVFIKGRGGYMQRWSHKEQAEAGHQVMVREMRNPINVIKRWWEYR